MDKDTKNKHHSKKSFFVHAIASSFIALSMMPVKVTADQYDRGLSAYQNGNYTQAFQFIKNSAEEGSAKGQFILSTMYRRGLGVEPDELEGFAWCKKAAEEGMLEAQFQLGLMYLDGEGVTDDETEAMKWLWAAAERGYPQASEVLQYIFSDGYETVEYGC